MKSKFQNLNITKQIPISKSQTKHLDLGFCLPAGKAGIYFGFCSIWILDFNVL